MARLLPAKWVWWYRDKRCAMGYSKRIYNDKKWNKTVAPLRPTFESLGLKEDDVARLHEQFLKIDKDGSGTIELWEMLDQHIILARALDLDDWLGECPKLATLHSSMRALPELEQYFAAPCYAEWSHNSPAYTHFTGHGDMDQGGTVEEDLVFPRE